MLIQSEEWLKNTILGGDLYEDNCFYVQRPITKVDDNGKEYEANDEVHVRFDMGRKFAEHIIVMKWKQKD